MLLFQNAFILGKHKAELIFEMSNFSTILEFPIIKGFLENSGSELAKSVYSSLFCMNYRILFLTLCNISILEY